MGEYSEDLSTFVSEDTYTETDEIDKEVECFKLKWQEEQKHNALQIIERFNEIVDNCMKAKSMRIGGIDISYPTWSDSLACACLSVYEMSKGCIVECETIITTVQIPYISGFLAYREMPIYRELLNVFKDKHPDITLHALLVDGDGRLHPRHFGSACMVGLEFGIPTVGIGKNPLCGEVFVQDRELCTVGVNEIDVTWSVHQIKDRVRECSRNNVSILPVKHYGEVIGVTRLQSGSSKPIYVSVGHLVSMEQAIEIVNALCIHRIPEPIRHADRRSRDELKFIFDTKNNTDVGK